MPTPHVLLVDDQEVELELVRLALTRVERDIRVTTALGTRALATLRATHAAGRVPDLVLLDLKMPGMTGAHVLKAIRHTPAWRSLPVVMLSASSDEQDIHDCYTLGCNAYVVKPLHFEALVETLRTLVTFWGALSHPPTRPATAAPEG